MLRQPLKNSFSCELLAKNYVSSLHSGIHISNARGTEFEFKEYRPYAAGDKLSSIDWRYYARSDQLHIRMREGKDNIGIHVFIDRTFSMNFASNGVRYTKFELAKVMGYIISLIAKLQRDNCCLGFSSFETNEILWGEDIFRALEAESALAKRCMWSTLKAEKNIAKGDIVFVLSDFYLPMEAMFKVFSKWSIVGAEVVLCHVCDVMDYQLPPQQNLLLIDSETQRELSVSTEVIAQEFRQAFAKHCENLKDLSARLGGSYYYFTTQEPPERQFDNFLKARKKESKIC